MTLARLEATGSGGLAARLEIEGWPMQPVSSGDMETTLGGAYNGIVRRRGLLMQGLTIHERVVPYEAHLEQDGISAQVLDVALAATAAFTTQPTIEAFLTASVDSAAVTLAVNDSSILVDGYYHVGTEVVQVTARPTGTSVTVTRARWGTTAQNHYASDGVESSNPSITNKPVLMTGRRAYLYLYGVGDSATGDGTLRYRGIVTGEPQVSDDLTTWTISIDAITSIWDQAELGAKSDEPLSASGVYYSWSGAMSIVVVKNTNARMEAVDTIYSWSFTGRFASQEEFCDALTASFDANVGTGSTRLSAEVYGSGWRIRVATPAASERYVTVLLSSSVDGRTISDSLFFGDDSDGTDGAAAPDVSTNAQYYVHWDPAIDASYEGLFTPRAEPRASYNRIGPGGVELGTTDTATSATYPNTRVYLDRTDLVAAGDFLVRDDLGVSDATSSISWTVSSVTAASGYVTVNAPLLFPVGRETELLVARVYGTGTLETLRSNIVSRAAEANGGTTPYITSSDWPSWATVVERAAAGRPWLLRRMFVFSKAVKLRDVLEAEMRLLGVYPYVTATGEVQLRLLSPPTQTEASTLVLTASSHIVSEGSFGPIASNPDGVVNVVLIKTGYDRHDDEYRGRTFVVRSPRSIGRMHGARHRLEVEPKVESEFQPDWVDAQIVGQGVMALYGDRYDVVTLNVPRTAFSVVLGDVVRLTLNHVPYNGARGIDRAGFVIEREWDLAMPYGKISVVLSSLNVAGYAPSARIDSQVNVSGNTWDLSIDDGVYGAPATVFRDLDQIRIIEWDAGTPSVINGHVDGAPPNSTTMTVALDSAWTPGGAIWNVCYGAAANVAAGDNPTTQDDYAFCGGSDGRITDLAGDPSAPVFAP